MGLWPKREHTFVFSEHSHRFGMGLWLGREREMEHRQHTQATWDTQNLQHGRDMLHMQRMEHVQHSQHTQHMQYMEHVRIRSNLIPAQEPESGLLPGANSADCLSHSLQDSKEC